MPSSGCPWPLPARRLYLSEFSSEARLHGEIHAILAFGVIDGDIAQRHVGQRQRQVLAGEPSDEGVVVILLVVGREIAGLHAVFGTHYPFAIQQIRYRAFQHGLIAVALVATEAEDP